jgi:Ca2+-binding EF-hand superfamily protein
MFMLFSKQQMTDKFKECDADNSGLVSLDEAKKVLRKPPFNFPDEKVSYPLR